jgi:ribosomal protein L11 methyltransferase
MVPAERIEEARAVMVGLFPEGFEEVDHRDGVELAAYTDGGGEERMAAAFGSTTARTVPADWPERWRRFHKPVRVGPLWVGPPWEEPPADAIAIVIDPGRAFGTGAHATTRLCLELLLELEPTGSVVDIGCGSGVLAIAAAKRGFAPVVGIDREQQAVAVARANAAANEVVIAFSVADAVANDLPAARVAVANVTREVIERLAQRVSASILITSGYLASEQPSVDAFESLARREGEGWAADLWQRRLQ